MPRSGVNGTYTLPPGTDNQVAGTPISPTMFNAAMDDVEQTLNTPTPVQYGGTNASTAADAATNLKVIGYDASATLTDTQRTTMFGNTYQTWELFGARLNTSGISSAGWTGIPTANIRHLRMELSGAFVSNATFYIQVMILGSWVTTSSYLRNGSSKIFGSPTSDLSDTQVGFYPMGGGLTLAGEPWRASLTFTQLSAGLRILGHSTSQHTIAGTLLCSSEFGYSTTFGGLIEGVRIVSSIGNFSDIQGTLHILRAS